MGKTWSLIISRKPFVHAGRHINIMLVSGSNLYQRRTAYISIHYQKTLLKPRLQITAKFFPPYIDIPLFCSSLYVRFLFLISLSQRSRAVVCVVNYTSVDVAHRISMRTQLSAVRRRWLASGLFHPIDLSESYVDDVFVDFILVGSGCTGRAHRMR